MEFLKLMNYEENKQLVLPYLPIEDHEKATEIIIRFTDLGYKHFGLWESWEKIDDYATPNDPTIGDIVAVNPKTGYVEFLR